MIDYNRPRNEEVERMASLRQCFERLLQLTKEWEASSVQTVPRGVMIGRTDDTVLILTFEDNTQPYRSG